MSLHDELNTYNDLLVSIRDAISAFSTENDIKRKMDERIKEIDQTLDPINEGIRLKKWVDKFHPLHTSLEPINIDSSLKEIKSHLNITLRKGSPSNQNDAEYRTSVERLVELIGKLEKITFEHKSQLQDFENYLEVNGFNSPDLSDIIDDDYNYKDYSYVQENVAKIDKKVKAASGTDNFLKELSKEEKLLYQRFKTNNSIALSNFTNIEWSTLKTLHYKFNKSEVNDRLKIRMGINSKYALKKDELPSNAISIQLNISLTSENAIGESLKLNDFDGIREWDIDIKHLFSIHLV